MKLCKRLLSALCAAALLFSFSASAMAANQTEETEQKIGRASCRERV